MSRRLLAFALAPALWAAALAQPPEPPKPPAINPANAKLIAASPDLGSPLTGLAFAAGAGVLVAGGEDGQLRLWTRQEGKELIAADSKPARRKAHTVFVTAIAAAGHTLVSASSDGKVLVWNLAADKPMHSVAAGTTIRAVAIAPDGKMVACAGDDGGVRLIDPASGQVAQKLTGPADWVTAVAVDGKHVFAGGHDGKLWSWDADGKKRFDVLAGPAAPAGTPANVVAALALSPDGKTLALGGSDARIHLFQTADGKLVRTMPGHTGTITALAYHPAGGVLISASKDRSVRLWNAQTGAALKTLEGHTAWVQGVALLQRGTKLASAAADRTVRLWDLGATAEKK